MNAASTTKAADRDWARFDSMSAEQRESAAREDRDAQPVGASDAARMRRTSRARIIRRALGWTEERFAEVFHIPVSMLRDWESGLAVPDEPTRAYLEVIASCPDLVAEALGTIPAEDDVKPYPTGPGSEYDSLRRQGDMLSGRS